MMQASESSHQLQFARALPLSLLAAFAASIDLCVTRGWLWSAGSSLPNMAWLKIASWLKLTQNIGVCSVLVALVFSGWNLIQGVGFTVLRRRFFLSFILLTLIAAAAVLLVLPRASLSKVEVVYALSIGHVVVISISLLGLKQDLRLASAVAIALAATTSLSGLLQLALTYSAPPALQAAWKASLAELLGQIAEPLYVLTVVAGLWCVWPRTLLERRLVRVAAVAVAAAVSFAVAYLMYASKGYDDLVFTMQRLNWLTLTGPFLSFAFAVAWVGLIARDTVRRQLRIALVLVICAGVLPLHIARLLFFVLGVVLFTRGATAEGLRQNTKRQGPQPTLDRLQPT